MTHAQALRDAVEQLATPQGRAYLRGCIACYALAEDDVEDLCQQALASAWASADRFDGRSKPATYVAAIVINAARNHLIRRGREERHAARLLDPDRTPDTTSRAALAAVEVDQASRELGKLPPQFGRAVGLAIVCASYEQAARCEGVAEATFKSRVWRARRALMAALNDEPEPPA